MSNLLQKLLRKPVIHLAEKFSSRPDKQRVFDSLTQLHKKIIEGDKKKGLIIPFDTSTQKFIIFSDQHKGRKNDADDFFACEKNYITALDYYFKEGFYFIDLGDGEEFWENTVAAVKKSYPECFAKEECFLKQSRFTKIFGNHDLDWNTDLKANFLLNSFYKEKFCVYEGCVLTTTINERAFQVFLTHGHQGDLQSDGNWLSKLFVAKIWGPLQSLLNINPNTPANNNRLKSLHNTIMYEWSSAEKNVLLITGHTHQPVFMSLTHLERLYVKLSAAQKTNDITQIKTIEEEIKNAQPANQTPTDFSKVIPSYFNSGCCCFSDGDITGIEIADGFIRLIKWHAENDVSEREVLEEIKLSELEDMLP